MPFALYAAKTGDGTHAGTVSTSATGTGTVNYLTKFTAANTIYDSQLFDNGTNIGLGKHRQRQSFIFIAMPVDFRSICACKMSIRPEPDDLPYTMMET